MEQNEGKAGKDSFLEFFTQKAEKRGFWDEKWQKKGFECIFSPPDPLLRSLRRARGSTGVRKKRPPTDKFLHAQRIFRPPPPTPLGASRSRPPSRPGLLTAPPDPSGPSLRPSRPLPPSPPGPFPRTYLHHTLAHATLFRSLPPLAPPRNPSAEDVDMTK